MIVHVLVSVVSGLPEGVQAYSDKGRAEAGLAKAKADLEIKEGHEEESNHSAALFYYVKVH